MNIIEHLFKKYLYEEQTNTAIVLIMSFVINILKTNGISFITAKIIESLNSNAERNANKYLMQFIGISVVFIIIFYVYKYFQNLLFTKMAPWLRNELLKFIMRYNNEEFQSINFVKVNPSVNRITTSFYIIYYDIMTKLMPNITFLIIISAYFMYKNPLFGAGFLIANIMIMLYFLVNWKNIADERMKFEVSANENEKYMIDLLNNMEKIVYRGKINDEMDIYDEKTGKLIDQSTSFYHIVDKHLFIMECATYAVIFASIGYLIKLTFSKKIDTVTCVTFITILLLYRDKFGSCIENMVDYIEFIGRAKYVVDEFTELIGEYKDVDGKQYEKHDLSFDNIEFENVTFKFPISDEHIYNNFNIKLDTNDKIIGITGLSGKGKSTFMKLLIKMYRPSGGAIKIDGVDLQVVDTTYLRQNITYVNQNSKMFDKNILDNILYGCTDTDACHGHLEEILKYKKIKELYKNIDLYGDEYKSANERLSGGQRQIINIIGGLVNPGKILILDEPTNGLDPELKQELLSLIKDFKRYKKCIMIITHDRDVYPLFTEEIKI